ncbi:ABC transporter permease [Streptomyces sp. 3MP-14]|uniref:Transport permease protein n=1 Tax=Streptomyces mimosae TaxID=2586635 RepID=A0A5N6A976_9ACTN|nr:MULTISPECIES: ABC transporter permease [Streptomyces]KAB8164553.1 ABC transporter permease [Streptomyces mimosae]KAB8175469.1 ABC transporter permease [Streptomyces sp. 3MP-14]
MTTVLADSRLIFERYARQTLRSRISLIFGLMQPMLFLGLFGPLLEDVPLGREGDSWQILVPGLLIQLGLFSAAFAGFGILIEKQLGIVERMRVTPVSRTALLLGRVLRDVAMLLVQSLVLVLAGVAFGLRAPVLGVLIGFVFVAVLALSLASLSYAFAMRVNSAQEFAPVINSINLPAMLLSGILLPMALAPAWLDVVSHFVPFRYLVDGVRAAFVGDYGDGSLALGALASALLAAVSLTLGTRLFRTAGA